MPSQYVSNNVSTLPHSRAAVNPFGRRAPIQLQYYNNIYMNIAKATYCVRKICTVLFVILLAFCLSWPLASMAKKRALLIGISHYPQTTKSNPCTWTNIHGSNDVRLLRGTLQKQGFRITTLTNAQATASHIRRALKRLCQQAAKGDMIVIHFSGHGQPLTPMPPQRLPNFTTQHIHTNS